MFTISPKHRFWPVLLCFFLSCDKPVTYETHGSTMGTTYSVKFTVTGKVDVNSLSNDIKVRLEEVNSLMSNWSEDSDTSRFNRHREDTPLEVSPHTARVIRNALDIADRTGGALDPTVSPLIELWGFGIAKRKDFPTPEAIRQARAKTGYHHLELNGTQLVKRIPELTLNLSASAKGYAVDLIAAYLQEQGIDHFMVEIGGEVRVSTPPTGLRPWRIGINSPTNPHGGDLYSVAQLTNQAMATSGDYLNFFMKDGVRYSHILDPNTGMPIPSRVGSVSVIASDCMTADSYATAITVLGPERGLQVISTLPGVECLILIRQEDGQFKEVSSPGMHTYLQAK